LLNTKKSLEWSPVVSTTWQTKDYPHAIISASQSLYNSQFGENSRVAILNKTNGQIMKENLSLNDPITMDIDSIKSLLYIVDEKHVNIFNFQLISQYLWKLPMKPKSYSWFRGFKVSKEIIYLTVQSLNQIFICQSSDGKLIESLGKNAADEKPGFFNSPRGVTVDNNFLYVCDLQNHRVQILNLEKGNFVNQWGGVENESEIRGQFRAPWSIVYEKCDEIFYIGDSCSVQLFFKNGECIQRLSELMGRILGLCVMDDRLYVSDSDNKRILIFRSL